MVKPQKWAFVRFVFYRFVSFSRKFHRFPRGEVLFKFPEDNNTGISIEERAAKVEAKWATWMAVFVK